MTKVQYLRDQAVRADRLAQNMLDTLTVTRLTEASRDYRQQADLLELNQPRIRTEHAAS